MASFASFLRPFLSILFLVANFTYGTVQVTTPKGQIIGENITVDGRQISRFLGIPYAKPPVGPLRFARPQPIESYGDNFQANKWPPLCVMNTKSPLAGNGSKMGKSRNMSEDCLQLNVWSPVLLTETTEKSPLKPVIVWIHGG